MTKSNPTYKKITEDFKRLPLPILNFQLLEIDAQNLPIQKIKRSNRFLTNQLVIEKFYKPISLLIPNDT